MKKKNPDATMTELGKMLGEAWKKASATLNQNMKNNRKLKDKYNADVEKYQKTKNVKNIWPFVKNTMLKKKT
eukprot:UN22238